MATKVRASQESLVIGADGDRWCRERRNAGFPVPGALLRNVPNLRITSLQNAVEVVESSGFSAGRKCFGLRRPGRNPNTEVSYGRDD